MVHKNISFEVFPPKKEGEFETAFQVVKELAECKPEFISVTYGAGGSRSKKTLEIASYIENELKIPAIAHLTCVGNTKAEILQHCQEFHQQGVSRVLALRGDRPRDMSDEVFAQREFAHATDLISFMKENTDLSVVAACYPETHPEAVSSENDLMHLKQKQELGVEFFISQLFFDDDCFFSFLDRARSAGITIPVHAGIMPITSAKQIGTSISLSGSSVPKKLTDLIEKYKDDPQDLYKAGIEYAAEQIRNLHVGGADSVHLYTMNKPNVAKDILALID